MQFSDQELYLTSRLYLSIRIGCIKAFFGSRQLESISISGTINEESTAQ